VSIRELLGRAKTLAPFCLGLVFLVSGIDKIIYMEDFVSSLHNRGYLPTALVWAGTIFTPGAEVVAGLTLLTRVFWTETAYIVGFLLSSFICVSIFDMVLAQNLKETCGCAS